VLIENREMIDLLRNSGFAYAVAAQGETETIRLDVLSATPAAAAS